MMRIILWLLPFLLILILPNEVLKARESTVTEADRYEIVERIIVRKNATPTSAPVVVLSPDTFVEVWVKEQRPKWFQIEIKMQRGIVKGYVLQAAWTRGARLQIQGDKLTSEKLKVVESAMKGFKWGVALAGSYFYQAARRFESENSGNVVISAMSGLSPWLEFFLQYSVTPEWIVQGKINNRSVSQKGEATLSNSSSAVPTEVTIHQDFIGFGINFRRYMSALGWWDFGLELDRGQSVTVEYSGESISLEELSLPLFVLIQGSGGYDFLTSYGNISPQVRLSYAANLSTPTVLLDVLVSFSF